MSPVRMAFSCRIVVRKRRFDKDFWTYSRASVVTPAFLHCNEIGRLAIMAGLGRYGRENQESVRRSFSAPTITQTDPSKIVFFEREVYGLHQRVFDCERICATITQEQCAASYRRDTFGSECRGCPIGSHFSGDAPIEEDRHTAINNSLGLACVRCEKSAHTNARLVGRMRLVRSATLCVSCANREYEYVKRANSKGAMPRLVLSSAIITIQTSEGEQETLDIGLRLSYHECARYVERLHPGTMLVKTAIGGEIIQQFSMWTPLPFSPWEPGMVRDEKPRKPKRTHTHRSTPRTSKKTNAIASPVDWDDWDTPLYKLGKPAESDESDADSSRQARRCGWLPPMSEEDDEAYRQSFEEPALDPESVAAHGFGDSDGLPEFVQWLCEEWPTFKSAPEWGPNAADKAILNHELAESLVDSTALQPPAPANATTSPEVAEPVSEPTIEPQQVAESDAIADAIGKLEAIKNPSRKVRRELGRLYEKQERRAAREAALTDHQQKHPGLPKTGPTPMAVGCRARALYDIYNAALR